MKVFSIMPICARNRPDASLPGCYNQPDPLSSHAAARIRFQKPGPPPSPPAEPAPATFLDSANGCPQNRYPLFRTRAAAQDSPGRWRRSADT
jgi:hypothetical protein